ncbi:MAG: response regulator [Ignavibacteriales bacterium]|nr:response regulator [Ignavibacteriales bacterium]
MNANESNNIQRLPKLLLVEDDEISVDVMRLFMKGFVEIDAARTAKETMDKVQANQYDLILMDINLGKGPTGIDLIKQIRELPNYKETKVIAVTAFAMKGDKEEFLSSGFDFYLAKPFTKEELRATIKRFLR